MSGTSNQWFWTFSVVGGPDEFVGGYLIVLFWFNWLRVIVCAASILWWSGVTGFIFVHWFFSLFTIIFVFIIITIVWARIERAAQVRVTWDRSFWGWQWRFVGLVIIFGGFAGRASRIGGFIFARVTGVLYNFAMSWSDFSFNGLSNKLIVDLESYHNEHERDGKGKEDFVGWEDGFFCLLF